MLEFHKCVADVSRFMSKFGINANPLDNPDIAKLRIDRQIEEIQELKDAKNIAEAADAVIDIMYIAAGNYYLLGPRDGDRFADHAFLQKPVLVKLFNLMKESFSRLPLQTLWEEVHAANMRKVRGSAETSKHNSSYDIVKPKGWIGPDIDKVLIAHGINPAAHPEAYYVEPSAN